jgi:hypothetical protein
MARHLRRGDCPLVRKAGRAGRMLRSPTQVRGLGRRVRAADLSAGFDSSACFSAWRQNTSPPWSCRARTNRVTVCRTRTGRARASCARTPCNRACSPRTRCDRACWARTPCNRACCDSGGRAVAGGSASPVRPRAREVAPCRVRLPAAASGRALSGALPSAQWRASQEAVVLIRPGWTGFWCANLTFEGIRRLALPCPWWPPDGASAEVLPGVALRTALPWSVGRQGWVPQDSTDRSCHGPTEGLSARPGGPIWAQPPGLLCRLGLRGAVRPFAGWIRDAARRGETEKRFPVGGVRNRGLVGVEGRRRDKAPVK